MQTTETGTGGNTGTLTTQKQLLQRRVGSSPNPILAVQYSARSNKQTETWNEKPSHNHVNAEDTSWFTHRWHPSAHAIIKLSRTGDIKEGAREEDFYSKTEQCFDCWCYPEVSWRSWLSSARHKSCYTQKNNWFKNDRMSQQLYDARGRSSVRRRGGGNSYKPPTLLRRRGSVVDMYGVESSAGANDCVQLVHTLHLVVLGYPELCPLTPYLLERRFERKCLFNPRCSPNCTCHIVLTNSQAGLTSSSGGWQWRSVKYFSIFFFRCFDPISICFDNKNKHFSSHVSDISARTATLVAMCNGITQWHRFHT